MDLSDFVFFCFSLVSELRVKVDGKSSDQKANTPRSKHSATEQRRRSKINDRQVSPPIIVNNFHHLSLTKSSAQFFTFMIGLHENISPPLHNEETTFHRKTGSKLWDCFVC